MKQWEEPESTKPVVEVKSKDGRETDIVRESGSDKAAALSRNLGSVPLELSQPPGGTASRGLLTLFPAPVYR
jgi:hypothetical protein